MADFGSLPRDGCSGGGRCSSDLGDHAEAFVPQRVRRHSDGNMSGIRPSSRIGAAFFKYVNIVDTDQYYQSSSMILI